MIDQGNGTRGQIQVVWAKSSSGHAMAYEIHDGKFYLIDGQSGDVYPEDEAFSERLGYASSVKAYRVDNLDINDSYIKEHNLVTNSDKAQVSWNNQWIAKDKKLNDLENEQAKTYTETPIDKAYIFLSQQKQALDQKMNELKKQMDDNIKSAQTFISKLFK